MIRNLARTALLALGLISAAARADQPGFALDRYEPGRAGSEWFLVDSLDLQGHWRPHFSLSFDWANKPLVIYNEDGSENRSLVRNQLMARLGFAVNVFDRARLSFAIPVGAYQEGQGGVVQGVLYTAPGAGAFGDPRFGADVLLLGNHFSAFTLVAGADVHVPLGSRSQFTGDGKIRIEPHLDAAGNVGLFAYAARVGFQYHRRQEAYGQTELTNQLTVGAAAGVRLMNNKLLLGPEITGATAVGPNKGTLGTLTTPVELIAGAHYRFGLLDLGAGAGPGLTHGYGSPRWRTVFSLSWGLHDAEPEPMPAYVEAVHVPEPPKVAKPVKQIEAPPAAIVAKVVAPEPDAEEDEVQVTDTAITIREQVQFALDSAEILHESDAILTKLRNTLQRHREITSLRVEGHTDTTCARRFKRRQCEEWNLKLSRERAKAVREWLVTKGIDESRLKSAGFGMFMPIESNKTESGRRKNRRVELHILAKGLREEVAEPPKDEPPAPVQEEAAPAPAASE